ncbi:hypothetical protein HH308_18890 [Gordonia sp. TBRC 11910]|uniref:Uncharacterized protein n=1 Tax=Gordonia asplenii TaxID=2725283 RepID=A0A848KWU3_9ACTN|nr:hypothetical protein [Gordonia asplenii]NMO03284.1 hypothetical protein [Gordonia asplenii]
MDPLVFERLVADVAQSVYQLDEVHAYGRSGQWQGGLDIVGWKGARQIVYQVRRIDELTAEALETAVREYASPTRGKAGKRIPVARPFPDAEEFVLVTSWPNDDTAIANKLEALKGEFDGTLQVRLIDSHALSRDLRFFGAIVAGYFGPYWAETFCHYTLAPHAGIGDAAGLLDDPLAVIGEREAFDRATLILTSAPDDAAAAAASAAETYIRIANTLRERALPLAEAIAFQAISAYETAGDYSHAFNLALEAAVDEIESCSPVVESLRETDRLAGKLDAEQTGGAQSAVSLVRACANWFERGYEVTEAIETLTKLIEHSSPHCARVGLLVAEQILTDEDDRDDHATLLATLRKLPDQLIGAERVRLRCAVADLAIMVGASPRDAYESLRDESFTNDGVRALVERRFGRACAYVGDDTSAINAYRRAVMHGWHAGYGGDVRKALRSIASVTQVNPLFGPNTLATRAMAGARATTNRDQLISGASEANINTLDNIANNDVPNAVRWAHHWLRLERINGAERDEGYARRNYARALQSADRHVSAVRQYINLGSRKLAGQAADSLDEFLDVTEQFSSPSESRRAAAAEVIAATTDLLPDIEVVTVATALTELFLRATDPTSSIDADDAIAALKAMSSLGQRLPETAALDIFDAATKLVPREINHYRYIDDELLNYFIVVTQHHPTLRNDAITQLLEMLRQDVGHTESRITTFLGDVADIRERIERIAREEDNATAGRILARWQVATPPAAAYARERIEKLMEEPLNIPKNTYFGGRQCTEASVALIANVTAGDGADIASFLQPWLNHLISRIRNTYMSAEERIDAAIAAGCLISHLESPERELIFNACIEQFDSPQFSAFDLIERANYQDPLARFKFGDGGTTFQAMMLLTAAEASSNANEAAAVLHRLRGQIRITATEPRIADLTAHTAMTAEAYDLVNELALNAQPSVRMAAARLWAQSPSRNDAIGEFLSSDPITAVRRELAAAVTAQQSNPVFEPIIATLKADRYASVRNAVTRGE